MGFLEDFAWSTHAQRYLQRTPVPRKVAETTRKCENPVGDGCKETNQMMELLGSTQYVIRSCAKNTFIWNRQRKDAFQYFLLYNFHSKTQNQVRKGPHIIKELCLIF